ncbi:gamma-butyrobetaine dioxygenase-like isoform X1 [Brachionus plicatilis]|uniref:Gamma-butyrobetaine dioxygenase-like isoform X1 n=1 Tax=Brachionus plicatilis TaxID=10195 RepID=A0A3M7QXK8_BRAPC|nr:gamma-butyrobetaine dioxygenase-like isoform X1 [Brachionus plicatilis]
MLKQLSILRHISNKNLANRSIFSKIESQSKSSKNQVNIIDVKNNKTSLELIVSIDKKEKFLCFDPHWLRFNCQSEHSRQIGTGQRIISIQNVPQELTIESVQEKDDCVVIKWNENSKQPDSVIPLEFLVNNNPSELDNGDRYIPCEEIKFFDYFDLVSPSGHRNETKIFEWLKDMMLYGLTIVKNLPIQKDMIKNLAELIAPIQSTIYDQLFDVKIDKNPINIAYSSMGLEFHMDLMYYESAPGIQFLHCLKFDRQIIGGESIFADAFQIAEIFRHKHPDLFLTLTKIPATFQKIHIERARPVYMVYQRPHIVLNHRQKIVAVNWAPPFEGPLANLSTEEIKSYYKAYIEFAKLIYSYEKPIEYRLKPGEVACFNNRRILHARNSFIPNNGIRHFQGCYINIDEFKSEALVKEYQIKYANACKNVNHIKLDLRKTIVGNQDNY